MSPTTTGPPAAENRREFLLQVAAATSVSARAAKAQPAESDLWYGGRGRPMTAGEADSLLEGMQGNAQAAGTPFAPKPLGAIREVVKVDDGREFVMVSLIRYRTKAVYPPGWTYGDDPQAANRSTTAPLSPAVEAGLRPLPNRVDPSEASPQTN